MGILNAFRKSGGGFLNNVDGVIVDYSFTTEPDFGGEQRERQGDAKSTPLWVKLTVRQDGSEANESTHLDAGAADDFVISDDGHTLEPVGDAKLWGNTGWMKLIVSLVENGVQEPEWEPGQPISFTEIIGQRVRFVQVKDEERMNRSAESFKKNKGQTRKYYNELGQKKGKDGKYYDQRALQVSQVYGTVDVAALSTSKPAAKTSAKSAATSSKASKATTKAQAADASASVKDFAGEVLTTILGNAKDNKVSKSKMNYEVTRLFATPAYKDRATTDRDPVRKFLYEDANLEAFAAEGLITFDKSSKDQTIALA